MGRFARLRLFADGTAGTRHMGVAAFVAYALLLAVGVMQHVPWSDEAGPWVMAREAGWGDVQHYFSYSGHPPLWFMVLFPLARAGLPIEAMQWVNAAIALAVAWLVLLRAPFRLWVRVMFMFGVGMGYQYAVVARGYMLMILVMFMIADAYAERLQRPARYGMLLALLFNTEAFVLIPAAMLAGWFARECWRARAGWAGVGIAALGAGIALAALLPLDGMAHMQDAYRAQHYYADGFWRHMRAGFLSEVFGQSVEAWLPFSLQVAVAPLLSFVPVVLALLAGAYLWRTRWLAVYVGWMAGFYVIFTYLYYGGFWHSLLFPVFTLWTLWLYRAAEGERKPWEAGLAWVMLLVLAFADCSLVLAWRETQRVPYSGSADMAAFIRSEGYDGQIIASVACYKTDSLMGQMPGTTFWIVGQERFSYYLWGAHHDHCVGQQRRLTLDTLAKTSLVLADQPMVFTDNVAARQLHFSRGQIEFYYLYDVKLRR